MQAISTSGRLTLPIRGELERLVDTHGNMVRDTVRGLSARFEPASGAPAHMRDQVRRLPAFGKGVGMGEDPFSRCGWWDSHHAQRSEGWTDEERELVEQALPLLAEHGVEFLVVEDEKLPAPWPKYDTARSVGAILQMVEQLGIDPDVVVAYERQNKNRQDLIDALEQMKQPAEPVADGPLEIVA